MAWALGVFTVRHRTHSRLYSETFTRRFPAFQAYVFLRVLATLRSCVFGLALSVQGEESAAKQLMINKGRETRIEDPEDEVWPLHVYEAKYGDYRTNGLGHTWADLGGNIQGVLVPGRQVFKVKRARAMSAVVQEVIA